MASLGTGRVKGTAVIRSGPVCFLLLGLAGGCGSRSSSVAVAPGHEKPRLGQELRSCKEGPWVAAPALSSPAPVATVLPVAPVPQDALSYPKLELGGSLVRDLPPSALTGKA